MKDSPIARPLLEWMNEGRILGTPGLLRGLFRFRPLSTIDRYVHQSMSCQYLFKPTEDYNVVKEIIDDWVVAGKSGREEVIHFLQHLVTQHPEFYLPKLLRGLIHYGNLDLLKKYWPTDPNFKISASALPVHFPSLEIWQWLLEGEGRIEYDVRPLASFMDHAASNGDLDLFKFLRQSRGGEVYNDPVTYFISSAIYLSQSNYERLLARLQAESWFILPSELPQYMSSAPIWALQLLSRLKCSFSNPVFAVEAVSLGDFAKLRFLNSIGCSCDSSSLLLAALKSGEIRLASLLIKEHGTSLLTRDLILASLLNAGTAASRVIDWLVFNGVDFKGTNVYHFFYLRDSLGALNRVRHEFFPS